MLAVLIALIVLPVTWFISALFSTAFGGLKISKPYDSYKRIPASERRTGDFSPATIDNHLKLMQSEFRERFWGELQKNIMRHVGSFICMCAVLYGLSTGHNIGLDLTQPLLRALVSTWITSFCMVTLARGFMSPRRRKSAKDDLLLIRSVHLKHASDHSMSA